MALPPTAAFGKKKTTTTTTLPDPGDPVTPPTLVNQATPPPSAAGGGGAGGGGGGAGAVDPVTGARGPVRGGAPPPVTPPPPSPVTTPPPVTTPTGGPIGPAPKVKPGTPAPNETREVIIKEGVYEPPGSKDTSDEAFDNALRELNISRIQDASNVDTTEAEDLIRELMQRQLGAQQVGQRASMGRAGFGSSGALAAMEGDAQQQAALGAQREILGLRRTEDQRAFDNAQDAAGTDIDYRRFGSDDEIRRAQLKALQDYLGLPGADAPAPAGPNAGDVGNSLWFGGRSGRGGTDDVDVGAYVSGENVGNQQTDAGEGETIRAGQTDYLVKEAKVSDDDVSMPPRRVTVDGVEYRTFRDPYGNPYVVKA